jgi:hypothetical protein
VYDPHVLFPVGVSTEYGGLMCCGTEGTDVFAVRKREL